MPDRRLSFGAVADVYDRARPGYPREAVRWLVGAEPTESTRVLELGAGTGKLTDTLVALGHNVMASDPDEQMLEVLAERVPRAHVRHHGAESIPLPDAIADVVVVGQAFHWFDHETAIPEIARVLKPGGFLALVWNTRDESVPWVRKLGRLIGAEDSRADQVAELHRTPELAALFPDIEERSFRHWQRLGRERLVDLARSRSNIAVMEEAEREETLAAVSSLYEDYGRGPEGMELPYVTRCFRAQVVPPSVPVPVPGSMGSAGASDEAGTSASGEPTDPAFSPDSGAGGGPGSSTVRFTAAPTPGSPSGSSSGPTDRGTLLIDFR